MHISRKVMCVLGVNNHGEAVRKIRHILDHHRKHEGDGVYKKELKALQTHHPELFNNTKQFA